MTMSFIRFGGTDADWSIFYNVTSPDEQMIVWKVTSALTDPDKGFIVPFFPQVMEAGCK